MARGTLVAESLRTDADTGELGAIGLQVSRIRRVDAGDPAVGQPRIWTMIDFAVDDERADAVAARLRDALAPTAGWYCDFRTATQTFVVFAGRILRYPRGDADRRPVAESYARSVGVPEPQLDWPE